MSKKESEGFNNQNPTDLKVSIGKNIAEYRKLCGFSQLEFAEKLNYSDKAVSKWERGESLPDIIVLKQIADLFGLTVNDLITVNKNKKRILYIKKLFKNKVILLLTNIGLIWLAATIVFVLLNITGAYGKSYMTFVGALPITFIVCAIYASIWKQRAALGVFQSLAMWTIILTIFLSVSMPQKWLLFLIGIPLQFLIVVINIFKRKKVS